MKKIRINEVLVFEVLIWNQYQIWNFNEENRIVEILLDKFGIGYYKNSNRELNLKN